MVDFGYVVSFYSYACIIFVAIMILGAGYYAKYMEFRKRHKPRHSGNWFGYSYRWGDSSIQARKR